MGIPRGAWACGFPLVATLVALGISLPAKGQAPPSAKGGPTDPRELAAFFDGLFSVLMADRHIPGAVALVARDGAIFFSKAYGAADLATGRLVDPETTLFRVASISTLFTATAVMQLWYWNLLGVIR